MRVYLNDRVTTDLISEIQEMIVITPCFIFGTTKIFSDNEFAHRREFSFDCRIYQPSNLTTTDSSPSIGSTITGCRD